MNTYKSIFRLLFFGLLVSLALPNQLVAQKSSLQAFIAPNVIFGCALGAQVLYHKDSKVTMRLHIKKLFNCIKKEPQKYKLLLLTLVVGGLLNGKFLADQYRQSSEVQVTPDHGLQKKTIAAIASPHGSKKQKPEQQNLEKPEESKQEPEQQNLEKLEESKQKPEEPEQTMVQRVWSYPIILTPEEEEIKNKTEAELAKQYPEFLIGKDSRLEVLQKMRANWKKPTKEEMAAVKKNVFTVTRIQPSTE